MANLIYNITSVNDGKPDDNIHNITKYLEFNKDNLLDLAEKNYENLVEAFTKNSIDIATSASSLNITLSLPQSSSTFSSLSDQSDTYRIKESEGFHNSKVNIAD
jgi:hypothetical protein